MVLDAVRCAVVFAEVDKRYLHSLGTTKGMMLVLFEECRARERECFNKGIRVV